MKCCVLVLLTAAMTLSWGTSTRANIVTFEGTIQGDFVFSATAAGQAIFGATEGVPLPLRTRGTMTFSVNDTGGNSALFTNATGQLPGVTPPTPAGFLPFYITPVRFDGGSLTNISRDGMGRIVSGTVVDLAMPWEMIGTGPNDGLVLYGDQATTPLLFSGNITLDYSTGTPKLGFGSTLSGAELFNTYLFQAGDRVNQNPGSDPLVFIGSNRTLTAVPEPSTLILGLGVVASMLVRSRRVRVAG